MLGLCLILSYGRSLDDRYGNKKKGISIDISKACGSFEQLVDKAQGKTLATALFEFSEVLEASPSCSSRYTALELLIRAADGGNHNAQHKLSAAYATGVYAADHLVPMDAGRSLLLEYVSALSGNVLANIGMGYRFMNGIGVVENCDQALPYYEYAANQAIADIIRLGQPVNPDKMKLSEVLDPNARWLKSEATSELTDYYSHLAEKGDVTAASTLGNLYLMGTRLIPVDHDRAIYYLQIAANAKNAAASGHLGYLLLKKFHHRETYGEEMDMSKLNSPTATMDVPAFMVDNNERINKNTTYMIELVKYAHRKGEVSGIVGLGFALLKGILRDEANALSKAAECFQRALGAHPEAGYYLGEIHMGMGGHGMDPQAALRYYSIAAQLGSMKAQHR